MLSGNVRTMIDTITQDISNRCRESPLIEFNDDKQASHEADTHHNKLCQCAQRYGVLCLCTCTDGTP
jgi:hypothetical protein